MTGLRCALAIVFALITGVFQTLLIASSYRSRSVFFANFCTFAAMIAQLVSEYATVSTFLLRKVYCGDG